MLHRSIESAIEAAGLTYHATDIHPGPGVDFVANFERPDCGSAFPHHAFGSVLVLNVLEHVFEPITVLDNAIRLARTGGNVVTITPCMWPVHNFPRDCQRLMPDWFVTYDERRSGVKLIEPFDFVGKGSVSSFMDGEHRRLPPPWKTPFSSLYTRVVNAAFNTSSRGQWAVTHAAIGAVFKKIG